MYLLQAPTDKFGYIPPNCPCISPEVRFTNNFAYTNKYYWKKIHCQNGCVDVSPKEMKKFRDKRDIKSAVFIAKGGIGDCLWYMPAIKLFKEKFPKCYVFIITDAKTKEIWKGAPFINGHAEDTIWNTQQVIMRAEEVYEFGGVATIFKDQIKREPCEAIIREMGLAVPKDKSKLRPDLTVTVDEGRHIKEVLLSKGVNAEKDTIITIGVDASTSNRHYPFDYIKEVSKALVEKNVRVVWLGKTPEFKDDCLNEKDKVKGVTNLIGITNLRMAMSVISLSDLHVNPNSGLLVISTALNIPTIGLFGAFAPESRCKYYERYMSLYQPIKCSPCKEHWTECKHGHPAPCMKNIKPSMLYKACLEMLKKYPRSLIEKLPIQ